VPETTAEVLYIPVEEQDLEIPGVEPLENLEIPGVEPIENLDIPGVDTEEIDPDNMEMNLEAPEMGEAPEETTTPEVLTRPPPVQSGEDGDNEYDSNGPPLPLSPRSDYTSDSDDEDDEPDEEIPDDEVYHPDTVTPSVQSNGLRPKRARDYSHMHANIVHHAMTQYSLNRGLRKFSGKRTGSAAYEINLLPCAGERPFTSTKEGSVRVPHVPKRKKVWIYQREGLR
jgi:hypothetical protein